MWITILAVSGAASGEFWMIRNWNEIIFTFGESTGDRVNFIRSPEIHCLAWSGRWIFQLQDRRGSIHHVQDQRPESADWGSHGAQIIELRRLRRKPDQNTSQRKPIRNPGSSVRGERGTRDGKFYSRLYSPILWVSLCNLLHKMVNRSWCFSSGLLWRRRRRKSGSMLWKIRSIR